VESNRAIVAIFNYVNLLRMHFKGDVTFTKERQKELVENIYRHTCELHSAETNNLDLSYANINNIIEGALALHAPALIQSNIRVKTILSPRLSPFYGDEFRLKQVFVALIALCVNHSPKGAMLTITTTNKYRQDEQQLIITFEDDGFALNKEDMDRLADIFVPESETSPGQLTFGEVEKLIQLHQGACHMEENRERGKKITITLVCRTKEEWEAQEDPGGTPSNVHWLFQDHPTLQ